MLRWMQQTRNYNTPSKPHAKHIKAKQKMQVHLKVERGSLRLHWLWSSGPLEPCTISLPVWRPEESAPWSPRFCVHCRPRCWQTWGYRRSSFSAWQVKKGQHASHHSLSTSLPISVQPIRWKGQSGFQWSLCGDSVQQLVRKWTACAADALGKPHVTNRKWWASHERHTGSHDTPWISWQVAWQCWLICSITQV